MKRILFTLFAMLTIGGTVYGDEFIVNTVTIPKSGKSALLVNFNTEKNKILGLDFKIKLPSGVEFVKKGGDCVIETGSSFKTTTSQIQSQCITNVLDDGALKVEMAAGDPISGSKGLIFAVQIQPSSPFSGPTTLTGGEVYDAIETSDGRNFANVTGCTFDIAVEDCDVVLDENSPFMPEATTGNVNILVKRTLTAGEWSTICLPFAIQSSDYTTIFGNDVQLALFKSYSSDDSFETMSINFQSVPSEYGLPADRPLLIKTSKTINSFRVNATVPTIDPQSSPESLYSEEDFFGTKVKGRHRGSYVADTVVPTDALFISNNQFYYSIGSTRMKAFRGYFIFNDKIKSPSQSRAFVDGEPIDGTTGIMQNRYFSENKRVYSISGRYMGENVDMKSLPKGVYIVDGVKIVNE